VQLARDTVCPSLRACVGQCIFDETPAVEPGGSIILTIVLIVVFVLLVFCCCVLGGCYFWRRSSLKGGAPGGRSQQPPASRDVSMAVMTGGAHQYNTPYAGGAPGAPQPQAFYAQQVPPPYGQAPGYGPQTVYVTPTALPAHMQQQMYGQTRNVLIPPSPVDRNGAHTQPQGNFEL
jgi:hypothetical protein